MSSLAVKYRPTTWGEVYGQDSVKRILQGQLNTGDIKNAYIFSGLSGSGKAQPLYERILTPAGYKYMRDIQIGDEVVDGKGKITTVLGVFPQGNRDCYRISFTDRTYIDVADNHLNSVWYTKNKHRYNQVITTEQLIQQLATPEFKRSRKMHFDLPVMDCWEDNNININSYLLGALLGDGGLSSTTLHFSNSEDDIIKKISNILEEEYAMHLEHIGNYDYSISYKTKWKYKFEYNNHIFYSCESIRAYLHAQGYPRFDSETILRMCSHPEKSHTIKKYPELRGKLNLVEINEQNSHDRPNILKQQLATYGLLTRSDKKHIPLNYLMSSVQTRLDLLRGLMDTDGHKGGRNFSTSAPDLAKDFEFLVRSLGIKCTMSTKIPRFNGKEYKKHFIFYLRPSNNMKIVSSEKMLANLSPAQREPDRTIKSITYIGKEECQCIYVDSPEHTYITSNFTVTHNTTLARLFANEVNNHQGFPIEMDMASNNGVDNVRNIINMAQERSINSKYKILILDECMTDDTEILTNQGWKRFDQLDQTELVAQYTKEGAIEFVKPLEHIKMHYEGDMHAVHIGNKATFHFTPNHVQPLYYRKSKKIKEKYIKDTKFNQANSVIRSGYACGFLKHLSPLDRIAIALQADGTLQHKQPTYNYWTIQLKKDRKKERLISLLQESFLEYREISCTRPNYRRFSIKTPLSITKLLTTHFNLVDMSAKYAEEFIEETMLWDGHVRSGKYYHYGSVVRANVDFCQSVATLCGFSSHIRVAVDNRKETFNDYHRLFMKRELHKPDNQSITQEIYQYTGDVYCVKVPSQMIIIRRDGYEMVTGNCHSLSTQGWNAFLKCIEEPPKYTIFIFCTTDPQKIPDTIKNRCMRLNFNRIPTNLIEERLKYICEQEHITGEVDKVCAYISRASNGGMRTAISMLETCINEDNTVTEKTCAESLGLFSYETYFNLINSMVDKNIEKILGITDELSDSGIDFKIFIDGFISFVLDLNKYIINNDIRATKIPTYLEDKVKYAVGFEGNNKILLDIVESLLEVKVTLRNDSDIVSTVQVMLISISRKI